jgi:hypothetical protein
MFVFDSKEFLLSLGGFFCFFATLIDHNHSKKTKSTLFFVFSISKPKKIGKTKFKKNESKPNILSKVFFVLLEFF